MKVYWFAMERAPQTMLEAKMACQRCASDNQKTFNSEIAIHFPGVADLAKPHVFGQPQLTVCLECGFANFTVNEVGLSKLAGKSRDVAQTQPRGYPDVSCNA
jgi:hypothetical protein